MNTKNTKPGIYECGLAEELAGISALQDTYTVYYFCNPTRGYVLIYQAPDGYRLVENWRGFTKSGGPWVREYAFERFLFEVKLLGGEA